MQAPIVFFDVAGPDAGRLRKFYSTLFAWGGGVDSRFSVPVSAEQISDYVFRNPCDRGPVASYELVNRARTEFVAFLQNVRPTMPTDVAEYIAAEVCDDITIVGNDAADFGDGQQRYDRLRHIRQIHANAVARLDAELAERAGKLASLGV